MYDLITLSYWELHSKLELKQWLRVAQALVQAIWGLPLRRLASQEHPISCYQVLSSSDQTQGRATLMALT
jgi:hypothetical protein